MPRSLASPGPSRCLGCATLAGLEPPPFTPNSRLGGLLAAPRDRDQPRGGSSSWVHFDLCCIPDSGRVCLAPQRTLELPPQPIARIHADSRWLGGQPGRRRRRRTGPHVPARGLVTAPVPRQPSGVTAGKCEVFLPTSQAVFHPPEPKEGPPGSKALTRSVTSTWALALVTISTTEPRATAGARGAGIPPS